MGCLWLSSATLRGLHIVFSGGRIFMFIFLYTEYFISIDLGQEECVFFHSKVKHETCGWSRYLCFCLLCRALKIKKNKVIKRVGYSLNNIMPMVCSTDPTAHRHFPPHHCSILCWTISYQPIPEYHKHLTAPPLYMNPPSCWKNNFFLSSPQRKNPSVGRVYYLNAAQKTCHCCSDTLPMKGVSRFLRYQEFVHRPLGSALLQTSWRDNMYSFISGSYYAGGRPHEE